MSYPSYEAVPDELRESEPPMDGDWCVLVEYAGDAQSLPPTHVAVWSSGLGSENEAWREARRAAFEFEPTHPLMKMGRTVYRTGEGYLSLVEGAIVTCGFTSRVAREVVRSDDDEWRPGHTPAQPPRDDGAVL